MVGNSPPSGSYWRFRGYTLLFLLIVFLSLVGTGGPVRADPGREPDGGGECLQKYLKASQGQAEKLRDLSMEMEIEASVPNLKKSGKLRALRQISRLGAITYRLITFQGDKVIQNDVIAKYLQAEKEAAEKTQNIGITPENYKFKYYGIYGSGDWQLHLFELSPRQKRPGLFKGWLWIEDKTALPVREQGEFVKSPSIFLKKIEFVRDYEIRDGVAVPTHIHSSVETRIVGAAEVNVHYTNLRKSSATPGEQTRFRAQSEPAAQ
jgi:hypothetical protein